VENPSEWLEYALIEVVTVEFLPRGSQLIKMAPRTLKNTVSIVFGAAIMGLTLAGTSSAGTHHIFS
jgi:hypothetical protein